MITDYPHNNSAEGKGGSGGTDRAVRVTWACKWWDFKSPVVWSWRIKHFCAPSQSQTKIQKFGVGRDGGGHLSSIPLMLPLQIPCSPVDTKLITNSCAPSPIPRPDSEKLKRGPQSLGCCAGPMLLGWGEWKSTKHRGTYAQFFLRCGLQCFSSIYFFICAPYQAPRGWQENVKY